MKIRFFLFGLLSLPAIIFIIRAWLWVFGFIDPISADKAMIGIILSAINYLAARIICFSHIGIYRD